MKFSVNIFCKNLILNLLIAAQICAASVFGTTSAAIFSKSLLYYDLSEAVSQAYLYEPADEGVYYEPDSALCRYVKSGEILLSRVRNEDIWGYDPGAGDFRSAVIGCPYNIDRVISLGSAASEAMKSQLKKGRWFGENSRDGYIECVIIGDEEEFPIGSVIDGGQFDVFIEYDGQNSELLWSADYLYKFLVVGSCGLEAQVFSGASQTLPVSSTSLGSLFEEVSYGNEGFFENLDITAVSRPGDKSGEEGAKEPEVTILCSVDSLCGSAFGDPDRKSSWTSSLIVFPDSVSAERKGEILSELSEQAGIIDFASMRQRDRESANNIILRYLPMMLCFTSVALIGVICVSALGMTASRRTFEVFTVCGMSRKKGIGMLAGYVLIVLSVSALLAFAVLLLLSMSGLMPWEEMTLGAPSVLCAILVFAVSGGLIMAVCAAMLKRIEIKGADG